MLFAYDGGLSLMGEWMGRSGLRVASVELGVAPGQALQCRPSLSLRRQGPRPEPHLNI